MEIRILAVGDVVGTTGLRFLGRQLRRLKKEKQIDFCIVNGENASMVGITPDQMDDIFFAGADVITLGNHVWNRREIIPQLEDNSALLRPANLSPGAPGHGWHEYETGKGNVAVINLVGRCHLDFAPQNPFLTVETLLPKLHTKVIMVEMHAEATSEKLAMAYMLDGRVSAVYGTHTHVPTADLSVLPKGTGCISDLGMTGPRYSVLGVNPKQSISNFRGEVTGRYEQAPGPACLQGAVFTVDTATGRCIGTEQVLLCE